jgi:hypothetical protein
MVFPSTVLVVVATSALSRSRFSFVFGATCSFLSASAATSILPQRSEVVSRTAQNSCSPVLRISCNTQYMYCCKELRRTIMIFCTNNGLTSILLRDANPRSGLSGRLRVRFTWLSLLDTEDWTVRCITEMLVNLRSSAKKFGEGVE